MKGMGGGGREKKKKVTKLRRRRRRRRRRSRIKHAKKETRKGQRMKQNCGKGGHDAEKEIVSKELKK